MIKYFKKVKKDKLVDFIKLINEDLLPILNILLMKHKLKIKC